uniref:Retrovirus-related Pol polyprotein from transposon 17.6 n=1 Tax=Cajanus cajan TaxID=3821 RepID=A0A151QLA6_CAJCA|nr:Retrovirus-related Pol polyprotein from transposon 17.6 [Cajanus cajan]
MFNNNQLGDWTSFSRALQLRFGPSSYENHQAELFKLKQVGTVSEYQSAFEKLSNQVCGLPPVAFMNSFISGLIPEIKNELAILRPQSVSQAIGLAKLIEAKLQDFVSRQHRTNPSSTNPSTRHHQTAPSISVSQASTLKSSISTSSSSLPIKRLNTQQIQERRAAGLCYNCDEKFYPGHKCNKPRFLLLLCDEEPNPGLEIADQLQDQLETEQVSPAIHFQLSSHALTGSPSSQTLKFRGHIQGFSVVVLIDTGSSHNIIQPRIANFLQLPSVPTQPFKVMVGNGDHISCTHYCPNVPISFHQTSFPVPLYILPIEGADVVLGLAWLRLLGPIMADFSIPSITFTHQKKPITLTETEPSPTFFSSQLTNLLNYFDNVFQPPKGLPPVRPHDHHIPLLPNSTPVNIRPYHYPHSQKSIMTTLISNMLQEGIITPSTSPFSSPVILVKKKDGTWRFCVDYRALNAITVRDRFPIPTIDELLDELGAARVFSKIDLRSGYHQIRVIPSDTHKTTFRTFDGHYEFLVMPFGLSNAPSTFQSAMNDLLRPFLRKFVLVFFDDILVYSESFSAHVTHLRSVLQLLHSNQFYAKLPKCVFGVTAVSYLGHVISRQGVHPDPEKIQAILDWPEPRSLTTLRGFLGLTGFYRRFICGYVAIATPLTDLLKATQFNWNTSAQQAFTQLKSRITSAPVLALPDFTSSFVVETDASATAIGAVLSQKGHPIAFFSKKLCPKMQSESVYVREMFAVTEAVKKWRQYLIGHHFQIITDQQSLKNLLSQAIHTPAQQKWATKLLGFDFDIIYRPGKHNLAADALSRPVLHCWC